MNAISLISVLIERRLFHYTDHNTGEEVLVCDGKALSIHNKKGKVRIHLFLDRSWLKNISLTQRFATCEGISYFH